MTRILMVCLGNICRSPLAHGLLQSKLPEDKFYVDSAGTGNYHIGNPPDSRSIAVAKKHRLDISMQCARQFKVSDFDAFDYIYAMDQSNFSDIISLARNTDDIAKTKLFLEANPSVANKNVPDPYHGDQRDFESVYTLIDQTCQLIASQLTR